MKRAFNISLFLFAFLIVFSLNAYSDTTVVVQKKAPCCTTQNLSKVTTPWGTCPQYNFWGCYKDKDCDCIPDSKDKCPMDKENYNNIDDTDGCPEELIRMVVIDKKSMTRDSDNDGITDDLDACPFTAGVKQNSGCPLALKRIHYYPSIVKYTPKTREYYIKIGSFRKFRNAVKELRRLRRITKAPVCIRRVRIHNRTWFRTYVGPFKSYRKAKYTLKRLHRKHKSIPYTSRRIVRGSEFYR